ncbi:endoglucanase [Malonomonas rubra DSM 5091]|uniref:Endoglucanase n=1 Tax=Malonomonas rubra DSM 5091 TaxID=1122189 RepID=A0A1M6KIS4_MALRU|nr:M42 family metallopeptidase [Malonomonas rubra]SHJ58872.1 endoglucanase [Malonomonas rubra DSM 5091]
MNKQDFNFLKKLVETPSPSGYEQPAQRVIRAELESVADDMQTDVMGNLISHLAGKGGPKLMLAGHCDEIGFMVQYVDDNGFIYFGAIGGVDPHLTPGQRVKIHTADGEVSGVIGKKAIHLIEPKDRDTVIKLKEQYIDIGCGSKEEVLKLVAIGDPVTFAVGVEKLQRDLVTSRAFDDKMGAFIVTEVMKKVKQKGGGTAELYSVSTVQEEIGLRGATTSSYGVNPDAGIVVEVTHATDYPGVEKMGIGDVEVGKGPVIARGPNINPVLFQLLMETAEKEKIPVQVVGAPRGLGNDANVMQLSRGGVATALVAIPLRYMHTPVEVLSLGDLDSAIKLLTALSLRLEKGQSFIPV